MGYLPVEFMTLKTAEDEYSRAMLEKQTSKGCSLSPCPASGNKDKDKDRGKA